MMHRSANTIENNIRITRDFVFGVIPLFAQSILIFLIEPVSVQIMTSGTFNSANTYSENGFDLHRFLDVLWYLPALLCGIVGIYQTYRLLFQRREFSSDTLVLITSGTAAYYLIFLIALLQVNTSPILIRLDGIY